MKGFSATTIVIFSVLVLVSANTSQFAFATATGTPPNDECLGDAKDETGTSPTITIDPEFHITGICIKTGEGGTQQFPLGDHSNLITVDGTYGTLGCYEVSGLLTNVVTVTDDLSIIGCMETSHVDYFFVDWVMVGGHGGITDNTALLLSGSHVTASWMIPLIVTAIGIGVFVFTRK